MAEQVPTSPRVDLREPFLETLGETQDWFRRRGIEYRIIGSLATSAYTEVPDECSLDFNRQNAYSPDQRVPDIDLVVPRADLSAARTYRAELEQSSFPVKLGLAFPSRFVDYRPNEITSYLTYQKRRIAVASKHFDSVQQDLLGVPITSIEPHAFLHMHYMLGDVRPKDRQKVAKLEDLVKHRTISVAADAEYAGFQQFADDWGGMRRSFLNCTVDVAQAIINRLPPKAQQRAYRFALPVASLFGLR